MKAMSREAQVKYLLAFYDKFEQWKVEQQKKLAAIPAETTTMAQVLNSEYRPFINHVVKPKDTLGATPREVYEKRAQKVVDVGLNSFYMPANMLDVDFLSDSGSSAMTTKQWAQLLQGDESYGSNEGWYEFNKTVGQVFGSKFGSVFCGYHDDKALNDKYYLRKNFNFLVNQGRGAENQFFPVLAQCLLDRDFKEIKEDHVEYYLLCTNNFFDTTSGHIIDIHDKPMYAPDGRVIRVTFILKNHPNPKVKAGTYSSADKYLGDGDFEDLKKTIEQHPTRIGAVFTTITNNSGGSYPVSEAHIKAASELCKKYNIVYMMDACRFAENCYMIKELEQDKRSVIEIVHDLFKCVDGFTISLKKDGIANCGGALCFSPESKAILQFVDQPHSCLLQRIMDGVILKVGHFTYGSLTGRDIKAVCEGLRQVVEYKYLKGRISQVIRMADYLRKLGVPILEPCGTSAVYLDIDKFFGDAHDKKRRGEFLGNSVVGLMLAAGIRGCELGVSAFYSPHGNAPYKDVTEVSGNFLRLAIPRYLYADSDLDAAVLYIKFLYDNRDMIKAVVDRPGIRQLSLHHFKMQFDYAE